MKISIITICFNSAATIEDTINSVLSQDYSQVEYIVVDGQSKDNTMDIVGKYQDRIAVVVSEPDKGLYDALNKGVGLATGDVVGILHSDDVFASDRVLSSVAHAFEASGADAVYGDLKYVDRENLDKVIRNWTAGPYREGSFAMGWMPPHPAFFAKRSLFEAYGGYNTNFASAADYELMLRFMVKHKISAHYLPECLVYMRTGGTSNVSVKNRLRANREDATAWQINDLRPRFYTRYMKPLRKLGQFTTNHITQNLVLPLMLVLGLALGAWANLDASVSASHALWKALGAGLFSWAVAMLALPSIVSIAKSKGLMDTPNQRSSHVSPTPTLGGIAVFAATLLGTNLFVDAFLVDFKLITTAGLVIFFSGIKDDLYPLAPNKKLMAQLVAAFLVVMVAGIKIDNLSGMFALQAIPDWVAVPFTIFTIAVIVNAINLIDGIDGLASGIGTACALMFGAWFAYYHIYDYAVFSFALAGSLIAFLRFNFSKKQKIFLGDTGSLVVGFSLSILAIQFISFHQTVFPESSNAPLLAFCVLIIPLFDLLRVFLVRIFKRKSPFLPDKTHVHHLFTKRNPSHVRATIMLIGGNLFVGSAAFAFLENLETYMFACVLAVLFFMYFLACRHLEHAPLGVYHMFATKRAPILVKLLWPPKGNMYAQK